jgi:hypothetical protein
MDSRRSSDCECSYLAQYHHELVSETSWYEQLQTHNRSISGYSYYQMSQVVDNKRQVVDNE